MALLDLLTALEEEGSAEHERAQAERRRQAAQIVADARVRAAQARADAVATAEAAAHAEALGLLSTARAAARRAFRTARDDALDEVLAQVRERLLRLPGTPQGAAAAGACAEEAAAALPGATTIRIHPADAAAVRPGVSLTLVPDLGSGGAVAETADGRYVDNTYGTRLANTWAEQRIGLSRSWEPDA